MTVNVDMRELGKAGNSDWSSLLLEDYNPDLRGFAAVDVYDKMRRNDARIRASMRVVKAPLLSGQWYIDPGPGEDEEAARFVWWALNSMSRSLTQMFYETLSFLDFGFYPFEIVYEMGEWEGKEVVKWKKWAPRHPKTIVEWAFDANGGINGLRQGVEARDVFIPIDKLLLFTFDEEGNSPEGLSLLRSAYKHWYYKEALYKIDAIQKERHGIGIPDIELPENYSANDQKFANELGRNLRTNEKAFIVRPPGMKVGFALISGQPVDVLASIGHHDLMISSNVLAQFLNLGSSASGSRAISESQQDMFYRSVRYISDLVRGVINKWAIPPLLRYNGFSGSPELKVRRIGESADWRAFSVTMRNLVEPGILTATPRTEKFVREVMDLPVEGREVEERDAEARLPLNRRREGSRTGRPNE